MSYHTLSAKPLNKSMNALLKRASHVGLGLGAFTPVLALANPTGAAVMTGQASISSPASNGLVIHQTSQSAIINWQQFNIGAGQYVQFLQPSTSSVVLNRVVGGSPTSIFGSLTANGQVFIVNTNGVFFGHGATIDAQGFLASSLDIKDSDFLSKHYVFDEAGAGNGKVVNQGNITAHRGGYVVLAGDYSENDGIISARSGHVILASGAKSTLTLSGNSLVSYVVNSATLSSLAGVANAGTLNADGGTVIMTADVANALKATVVNNTGLVEARSINRNYGGIYLTADGGNLVNAGTLDADAMGAGHAGGNIVLKGDGLTNLTNTSKISALGIGGTGGNLELSGTDLKVRGSATLGKGGHLLLDPTSVEIVAGSATSNGAHNVSSGEQVNVGQTFIETQLNNKTNVAISAHTRIFASASVHDITATTKGGGNLSFKTASNGHIDLAGVDITITGNLTASMGYGSFGHIQAGSVDLNASHSLALARAVKNTHGVITQQSVLATKGTVTLNVGSNGIRSAEGGSGADGIAIKAKTGANVNGNINNGSGNVTLVGQTVDDNGNITTTGNINVTASAGYADLHNINDNGSGSVNISATGSDINVGNINAYGGNVTITATGGNLNAGNIDAANGNVAITDTSGDVSLKSVQTISSHANASINDAGHTLTFQSDGYANAGGNLTLKAKIIAQNGPSFDLTAGGDLTVKGTISLGANSSVIPVPHQTPHSLDLTAGGTIKLDHSVSVPGAISVHGGHLAFIGKGASFTMSAGYGNLLLDASIGSAAHAAKYNVTLKDGFVVGNVTHTGYGIFLQRSIHLGTTASGAAANFTAIETGSHGRPSPEGVLVGDPNGTAVTVAAAGNVTLSGWNVGVGSVLNNHASNYGPVTIAAGKNVSMTGNGTGSHGGNVTVEAGIGSYGGINHDNSVLITAGGNINMTATRVTIQGGIATANGNSSDSATVTLKAAGKVTLTGGSANSNGNAVDVQGGSASASAGDNVSANANAAVSISGNKGVTLHATHVNAYGGSAAATASAEGGVAAHATANAGVQLASKSGNIALTTLSGASAEGGVVNVRGGKAGFEDHAHASGEGAIATATAHADVTLNAGGAINLSAFRVHVSGGSYGAGAQSHGTIAMTHTVAKANGSSATATFTATNGVNFTAGAAGINITGGDSVSIHGGNAALNHAGVVGSNSGHASANGNGAVNFVTTGNLNITASSGSVRIQGGSSAAARSKVNGNGGAAVLNANSEVNMTAAAVILNAKNGSVTIHGGGSGEGSEGAAQMAGASAEQGGIASITGLAGVAITATTGGISVTAKNQLSVRGGQSAAAGQERFNVNSSSGTNNITSTSFTKNVHHHSPLTSYASATADGQGTATLIGTAGVALTAKGALSLTQTSTSGGSSHRISIGGGGSAGASAHVNATGGGATATLTGEAGIVVKAASLKVTGKNVNIFGGGDGARGAATGYGSNFVFHHHSNGGTSHTSPSFTSTQPQANHAGGAGSKITLNGNSAVTLQAGTISLTALNGHLEVSGGYGAAARQRLAASSGGSAAINANDGITITAKTAFTAAAKSSHGSLRIEAGGGIAGSHASVQADGVGSSSQHVASKAQLNGNGQVTITAPTVTLTAGNSLSIEGRSGNASNHANVIAAYGGSAGITAKSAVNITVAGNFTASLSGSGNEGQISIVGGDDGGDGAHVHAHGSHAKAAINTNADVNITATAAGGVINISTGNHKGAELFIAGGARTGKSADVTASGSASAAANLSANVNLTAAAGKVVLNANKGDLFVGQTQGNYSNGRSVTVDAGYGTATFTANDDVNVNAVNIKLNAGTYTTGSHGSHVHAGNIDLQTGANRNAEGATVTAASYGAATFTENDLLTIKATGTLAITAGGSLDAGNSCCNVHIASAAKASANGHSANAAFNLNESMLFQGNTAVKIIAGNDLDLLAISSPSGGSGSHPSMAAAGASAKNGATATYSDIGQLNIVTKGAFTASAGEDLEIGGGRGARFGYASASGAGAKATNTTDASLNISANTVSLSAGSDLDVFAGRDAAWNATASAKRSGVATLSATDSVNITAKSAITMTLTGSGSNGSIDIGGGGGAGNGAQALVSSHGGTAKLNAAGATNLTVTGAGGTITLTAGKHKGASIDIGAASDVGGLSFSGSLHGAAAVVQGGGSASANFVGNTNLSAKGALTINAGASGSIGMRAGELTLTNGLASANGGKATLSAQSGINLSGGTVALTAGDDITITAATQVAAGFGPGPSFFSIVTAKNAGVATMNAQTGIKITAAGAFTATAGSNLDFFGNGNSSNARTAASAHVEASHGAAQATLTANNSIQVNAATIALKVSKVVGSGTTAHTVGSFAIVGGSSGAERAGAMAVARNDKATINVDDSIDLTATGNFSVVAGKNLFIAAGGSAAASGAAIAGNRGIAKVNVNAGANIKTGGTLTLTAGNNLDVSGGDRAKPSVNAGSGGSASATVNANVSLTAAKAAKLTAGNSLLIQAGGSIGTSHNARTLVAQGGKATENVNTSVSLVTGGALTITAANDLSISGGGSIKLRPVASDGGVMAVNVNTGVTVKTGGNLSLAATAGSIALRGGGDVRYLADFTGVTTTSGALIGSAGRSIKANLNTGVDVEAAGSATAVAGTNLLISAGDGALLAVGKYHPAVGVNRVGTSWEGGSASVTGSFGATFKAGKNLTLTAGKSGTGSLAIDALQGFGSAASVVNAVSVRGGSSHADAKFNVDGDALVQAGGNITVSVANNMGVYAGSFGDARIDHVNGSATMVATANATLKAGGNITFAKVGGDLTVAGIGVNSSHAGALVGEGAGLHDSGGSINVAVNANALISAGGNITTTTAIGGDIAVLAANDIVGFAVGPTAVVNTVVNGNAGITGGGNVTLAAAGNISVMGPGHVQASVASMATSGQYSMKVQGKTTVSAGGNLTLTAGGNLTVAGGDGVTVDITKASSHGAFLPVSFTTGLASADVSANLHAGKAMTLNASGNLWIRGGSDADAHVQVLGGFNSFNGTANADANVTAGTNLTIVAGSGATFQGGSNASATAWGLGSANKVTANGHADLNVTVGGNLTVTATGPVNVFGGPLVEGLQAGSLAAVAVGNDNVASANGSAKVNITAAGNVAITARGGNLTIAGASSAASFRQVLAGSRSSSQFANTAKLTADGSVNIKGKAVTLTATRGGNVDIIAGRQGLNGGSSGFSSSGPLSHANRVVLSSAAGSGNVASLIANSSVNITAATTLTIAGTNVNLQAASAATTSSQVRTVALATPGNTATATQISGVILTAPTLSITPPTTISGASSFSSSGFKFSGGVVHNAALTHGTANFGGVQVFSRGLNVLNSDGQNTAVHTTPTASVAPVKIVDLGSLQSLGLVTHLVTVLGDDSLALVPKTDAFSVSVEQRPSLLAPQATGFTPAAYLGSGGASPAGER